MNLCTFWSNISPLGRPTTFAVTTQLFFTDHPPSAVHENAWVTRTRQCVKMQECPSKGYGFIRGKTFHCNKPNFHIMLLRLIVQYAFHYKIVHIVHPDWVGTLSFVKWWRVLSYKQCNWHVYKFRNGNIPYSVTKWLFASYFNILH